MQVFYFLRTVEGLRYSCSIPCSGWDEAEAFAKVLGWELDGKKG